MRFVLVEPLLQTFQELLLEPIDVLDVSEDGAQLIFCEHVHALPALFDVTLQRSQGVKQRALSWTIGVK